MCSAAAIWDQGIGLSLLLHFRLFAIVGMMLWCAVLKVCYWIEDSWNGLRIIHTFLAAV